MENPNLDMVIGAVKEKLYNISNELYEMRFNMKTGEASQKKLSASAVDFPRVNESYTGRKQRYVYGTTLDSIAKVTGIIKFDLHAKPDSEKKQSLKLEEMFKVFMTWDQEGLALRLFMSHASLAPILKKITDT